MSTVFLTILIIIAFVVGVVIFKPLDTLSFLLEAGEVVYQLFFSKKPGDKREAAIGCLLLVGALVIAGLVIAAILFLLP